MFRLAQILLASLVVFVPTMSMAGPAEDAAAAIDRLAAAYSANDVEAMLKVYAPDAISARHVGAANQCGGRSDTQVLQGPAQQRQ